MKTRPSLEPQREDIRPALGAHAGHKLNKAGGIVGRWTKGQSGNPRGRPSQAPFKAAMAALQAPKGSVVVLEEVAVTFADAMKELAKK